LRPLRGSVGIFKRRTHFRLEGSDRWLLRRSELQLGTRGQLSWPKVHKGRTIRQLSRSEVNVRRSHFLFGNLDLGLLWPELDFLFLFFLDRGKELDFRGKSQNGQLWLLDGILLLLGRDGPDSL
jgi:hypothetical protein